jgi:hypothetical protein
MLLDDQSDYRHRFKTLLNTILNQIIHENLCWYELRIQKFYRDFQHSF